MAVVVRGHSGSSFCIKCGISKRLIIYDVVLLYLSALNTYCPPCTVFLKPAGKWWACHHYCSYIVSCFNRCLKLNNAYSNSENFYNGFSRCSLSIIQVKCGQVFLQLNLDELLFWKLDIFMSEQLLSKLSWSWNTAYLVKPSSNTLV